MTDIAQILPAEILPVEKVDPAVVLDGFQTTLDALAAEIEEMRDGKRPLVTSFAELAAVQKAMPDPRVIGAAIDNYERGIIDFIHKMRVALADGVAFEVPAVPEL